MNTHAFIGKHPVTGILALAAISVSLAAQAGPSRHEDYARVVSAEPVYETYERRVPREHCWVETVREEYTEPSHSSATPTLVGGIVGGAIGNAVGRGGDNKKIGAVVGSLLGMSVGHDIGKKRRSANRTEVSYRDVERCETRYRTHTEQELVGYDVVYKYRGNTYTTFTDRAPGDRIRVAVEVTPVSNY